MVNKSYTTVLLTHANKEKKITFNLFNKGKTKKKKKLFRKLKEEKNSYPVGMRGSVSL